MTKVVLADDEEFVRYFLKAALEDASYEVVAEVEKGDELLNILEKHNPDIVLLDINMPNLTGVEFLQHYASKFSKTCIIILTSATSASVIKEVSTKGAKCVLRKDMPIEKMLDAIEQAWDECKKEKHV